MNDAAAVRAFVALCPFELNAEKLFFRLCTHTAADINMKTIRDCNHCPNKF